MTLILQVVSNANKLLLCSMSSADRRTVAGLLSSALGTMQLQGKGIDVPTASGMLDMLAAANAVSTCQDPCADAASPPASRRLMVAFSTQLQTVSAQTAADISSNLDLLSTQLLARAVVDTGYTSTSGANGLYVAVAIWHGDVVAQNQIVVGVGSTSVSITFNTQLQSPCSTNTSNLCSDGLFNIAAQMSQLPESFITQTWQEPSTANVTAYITADNSTAKPPLKQLEVLSAAVRLGVVSSTYGLDQGGRPDVSCVGTSCSVDITFPLLANASSGKQFVCLQVADGHIQAADQWMVYNATPTAGVAVCRQSSFGTFLLGQFTPTLLPSNSSPSPQQGVVEASPSPSPQPGASAMPTNVTMAVTTFTLAFPLAAGTTLSSLQQSGKLATFVQGLQHAIALKTGVDSGSVVISNVREGSIIADVTITAAAAPQYQAVLTSVLVTNPATLFQGTGLDMATFGILSVSGVMTSTKLLSSAHDDHAVAIGVGVGVGVGGALLLAGIVTAVIVKKRARQVVGMA